MKKVKINRICLSLCFLFSLLAVGCSQSASGSGVDDEDPESESFVLDDPSSSSNHLDKESSSSEKESAKESSADENSSSSVAGNSSGGLSSSSTTGSSASNSSSSETVNSSSGAGVSSAVESSSAESSSSSSFAESSSSSSSSSSAESSSSSRPARSSSSLVWNFVPEEPYTMDSPWNIESLPSADKVQPKINGYPYYDYVSSSWTYDNTTSVPPYYDPSLFTEQNYTWVDADQLGEIKYKFYYMNIDTLFAYSNFVRYAFYPTGARWYLFSVAKDKEYDDFPLLRVLIKNEYNEEPLIEPIEKDDRWYYVLDAAALGFTNDLVKLVRWTKYGVYGRTSKSIIISDDGTGYTKNFNVNMIVAGKYMGTADNVSVEELAKRIHARLNYALNPGGIGVRKVNILYAKNHPTVGSNFPETEGVDLETGSSNQSSLAKLYQWPGHEGEISIALGYRVINSTDGAAGFSPIPGQIYQDYGPAKCQNQGAGTTMDRTCLMGFALATHLKDGSALGSINITAAAIHELGHFFGLAHTTSYGNPPEFDDLSDTPECASITTNIEQMKLCDDYGYIMFPYSDYKFEYATFTPQQMKIIRTYLATTPHK